MLGWSINLFRVRGIQLSVHASFFLLLAWFAGRIYRVGILMYGKKPSWKEMIKWAFAKS